MQLFKFVYHNSKTDRKNGVELLFELLGFYRITCFTLEVLKSNYSLISDCISYKIRF